MCNEQQQMTPDPFDWADAWRQVCTALKCALLLTSYIAVAVAAFKLGERQGVDKGRSQFHREILDELDAKDGAPLLIYPPTEPRTER